MSEIEQRLASWLGGQLGGDVTVEDQGRADVGHSAETLLLTVVHHGHRQEVVVRLRPPAPGLLEPYDLNRQFTILRALEPTPVRAPRALWLEPTGDVLGRPFYVMERLPGQVYERGIPDDLAADPARMRRMCEGFVEQLAAIHRVDLKATGLDALGDGSRYLDTEIDHWTAEIERVKRGPLPRLERLVVDLRQQQPDRPSAVTLVHGDAKPGNYAYVEGQVTAVFDWEMATLGDPRADLGWAEVLWDSPGYFTSAPGVMAVDDFVARWQELTGLAATHRPWFRAFQTFKMAVILLVGGHLFDAGHTDDMRFAEMTLGIGFMTQRALDDLGVTGELDVGPVTPRRERIREVKERSTP